jgi:HTH-type transcriptional regulator/antitoxin HigA
MIMYNTFDRGVYTDLLLQVSPKVIETEEEYEATLAIVEFLVFNHNRTPEQTALYQLLVMLVEAYEEEHYSITEASPVEVLNHILEASETTPADLVGLLGSSRAVSEIVSGTRTISNAEARILSDRFKVSPSLFTQ